MPSDRGKGLEERAQAVLLALKAGGVTIVTAESCTAGAIAAPLAQGEGASEVLHGGFIVHTKAHKSTALGVSPRLLEAEGAVNAGVVKQMAQGALDRSPASLAVAVSGVLGPTTDEDANPVGLVYFCTLAADAKPEIMREEFGRRPHDELLRLVVGRAFDLIEDALSSPVPPE